ncbi:hypothetical protein [Acidithiobacillus thiooxidans]|uniref:Lipoprotein n=1 Tax=Acidithiobacillus thiooxidans ATCC 19377 TaxID=637390 RepID=A0A543PZ99_ACITH|nr:hypothetical protein [Acidithiobacillus thiooxidans]MDX5936493.1 hypothetical protein [Acidithiobacillus thiooxidans]TQN49406.1 hypothetical protein DLNHIDIE_03258 [Acidithiobacillus thiooxidans ATCC 19377]
MKNYLILTTILIAVTSISGCSEGSQVTVKPISKINYAPTSLVQTLTTTPSRPYIVIAHIHSSAPAGTPAAQVIAGIEKQAEKLGANAVIINNHSHKLPSKLIFNPSGGNYQNEPSQTVPDYSGIAIRWVSN